MKLAGGVAQSGGAIYAEGAVNLFDCELDGNTATERGGAIFSKGKVELQRVYMTSNEAQQGGALYLESSESI